MTEKKQEYIELMKRNSDISSHLNCSICRECGGKCCKESACGLMPCDVPDMSVEGIKKMLDTGKYSIMFFVFDIDGDIAITPVMGSREIDSDRVNYSLIRKPCALQTEHGCSFSDDERPTLGLLFIPQPDHNCRLLVDGEETMVAWSQYRDILEQVVQDETGKTSEELLFEKCIEASEQIEQKFSSQENLTRNEMRALHLLDEIFFPMFDD